MTPIQSGKFVESVSAVSLSGRQATPVVLNPGTYFVVEIGKFEWLGHEGLYSEISLPAVPGSRYRIRHHELCRAAGKSGIAVAFREKQPLKLRTA